MMYPSYSDKNTCGGTYTLNGNICSWEAYHDGMHVSARIYGDYRYEGKVYTFPTRRDALIALESMIFAEVA